MPTISNSLKQKSREIQNSKLDTLRLKMIKVEKPPNCPLMKCVKVSQVY
jgi:hypothetical protein